MIRMTLPSLQQNKVGLGMERGLLLWVLVSSAFLEGSWPSCGDFPSFLAVPQPSVASPWSSAWPWTRAPAPRGVQPRAVWPVLPERPREAQVGSQPGMMWALLPWPRLQPLPGPSSCSRWAASRGLWAVWTCGVWRPTLLHMSLCPTCPPHRAGACPASELLSGGFSPCFGQCGWGLPGWGWRSRVRALRCSDGSAR